MKWFLRILGGIVGLLVLVVVGALGYAWYDINMGANASELTNVSIEVDDLTLNAYLAQPEGDGTFPAVLMIHEWWGLRPDMIEKADALAAEGYVVLAVDSYRGIVATSVPGALLHNITYDQTLIDADMVAFYDYLVGLDNVDNEQVAVMGYCFGGRQSIQFGVLNPEKVTAILTYYGGSQINDVEGLAPLADTGVSVLGIFGEEDMSIPLEDVETFRASLEELGITHEITVYPEVGHAFVKDIVSEGASRDAWLEGLDFLNRYHQVAAS